MGSANVAILIATYNRAALLGETLDVLSASVVPPHLTWEVIVVDNNSTDETRQVVTRRQSRFPVPLHYLFEEKQGRSAALNTAIKATRAPLLLCTDDDVRVDAGWLEAGWRALAEGADYVGGRVVPIWEASPPAWLDLTRADLWGTIAILDYGDDRFCFEERKLVPLGANMGMRRSLIEKIGGFRAELGRTNSRKVLGQEVPELLARARAAGLRGVYVPAMAVHHHIPKRRLTKQYYRRWWMGKGYSKAVFEALQPVTELGLDLRTVPYCGAIPRYMLGDALRDVVGYVRALVRRDPIERFRHAMRLAYLVGFVRARGIRRRPVYSAVAENPGPADVAGSATSGMLNSAG
jgi:glycosyltransferase involved in cell wall biosynthesis